MPALIEEFLLVLAYSRRTQWALFLGVFAFVVMLLGGSHFASTLNFEGMFAPFTAPIQELILKRYGWAALCVLISFLVLATKCYRKDRKRLFS